MRCVSVTAPASRAARACGLALIATIPGAAGPAVAQDQSFQSQGVELHYRTAGSGIPLVLLSGGPGFDVDYMASAADFFPAGYQRIFLEQRGTGRSRVAMTPESMTLRVAVDDLEALRTHLKQERLLLAGHSWGGMLAMAYAAAHPDRVDRLILIGSGGPTLEFAERFTDNIAARLRPEDIEARRYWDSPDKRAADPDKAAIAAMRAIVPGYFFDRARALAFAAELKDGTFHPAVNSLLMGDLGKGYDLRARLKRVDRPVLIIQGYQDPIGEKTAGDIHGLLSKSTLRYINKCGHFPWIEQPEEFRQALAAFLNAPAPGHR